MSTNGKKETACSTCMHRDVCSNLDLFLKAQAAVDNVIVDYESSIIKISDITFIRTANLLECKHYLNDYGYRHSGVRVP